MHILWLVALPDKPTNLTVTAITSRSAVIFWEDPKFLGRHGFTNFRIELKRDKKLILGITIPKVNKYKIKDLTPYNRYEISVAAEHYSYGLDDGNISSFSTSEEGECKNYIYYHVFDQDCTFNNCEPVLYAYTLNIFSS